MIGDGFCNDETNHAGCNYDGGDCCKPNKVCWEYSVCECKEDVDSQNTITNTVDSQDTDTDPNYIFPKVRSACDNCNCGYVRDTSIEFIGCHESHRYICEYKGGPSCPDGMFSLYGKCLGFVKNIMDDNTANDKTCYFQSGAVHNYRLAEVENVQVQFRVY